MVKKFDAWLEGSLFFRIVSAVMDFIGRVAKGSFIISFFTADYDEEKLRESRFVKLLNTALNKIPKPFAKPGEWPKALARVLNGSRITRTLCEALDTPVTGDITSASPARSAGGFARGIGSALLSLLCWFGNAVPIWTMLAVTAAAPLIGNSMPLAVLLAGVFLFTWLSRDFKIDLITVMLILLIGIQLFMGVTSFHFSSSIQIALITVMFMLSFLIVNACLVNRKQFDIFLFVFIAVAMITGLIGIYQLVFKIVDMTWVDVDLFGDIQFRTFASFGNPNVYGTYLLLALPLCSSMVFYVKKPLLRILSLGVSGLLLYNLVMTYSRGCYLALAVAALVFVLLIGKRVMVFFAAGVITLPVTVPLILPYVPATVLNRLLSITNLSDSSTSYRLSIWQGTLRILKDFWAVGLGQGIEAYNAVYPYYAFNAVVAPHSHNVFLQIFVETGIIGLLVFFAMLAAFFRTMAGYLRREGDWRRRTVAMAMIAGTVGFLFQGIFDYVFYNYRVMLIFYIYLGLGIAFARIGKSEDAAGRARAAR